MEDTEIVPTVSVSAADATAAGASSAGSHPRMSANYRDNLGPVVGMRVFGSDTDPILAVAHANGIIHCYDTKTCEYSIAIGVLLVCLHAYARAES